MNKYLYSRIKQITYEFETLILLQKLNTNR